MLDRFHPVIRAWFQKTIGEPTTVQQQAWPAILQGSHTLIAAPTGSGKTLAALLPCLDRAVKAKLGEALEPGSAQAAAASPSSAEPRHTLRILYITPLKALNNDIQHHVAAFAEKIEETAGELGLPWPGLRAAVRTGDTTPSQRAAMLRRPPDVLVTTPESLYILLTSEKGRRMLRTVEQVIVDEIHDLAADKRGAHLSLSLERLEALCRSDKGNGGSSGGNGVQRIGVSATQKPLERVARFLGGWEGKAADARPRSVAIVESQMERRIELLVTMPPAGAPKRTSESVWVPIVNRILELMEGARSVLIFVNSRRLCERLTLRLNEHVGYELARSHHGSVHRERRLEVERMLKDGELRALVATSSLELGIDVGHIELVLQLDSPLEAAAGIQRIGRAGHAVGGLSRGVILARARGALPEIAVLSQLIATRDIEPISPPENPLDVLSQHTVAMAASAEWDADNMLRLIRRSDSFHTFPEDRFNAMLKVLGGFYPFARPLLHYEPDTKQITRRPVSPVAALTGAGTIPQSASYPVHHAESRIQLGDLDEEFIQESRAGDVFQLGTSSWMIQSIQRDRVYVVEAPNRFSEVPFWKNEAGGRSYGLGVRLGAFWSELDRLLTAEDKPSADQYVEDRLVRDHYLDSSAARGLIAFVRAQQAAAPLPTGNRILIEYYRDVMNRAHVVIHNFWGKRVNRTWQLAIEQRWKELLPYSVYANAKDNGIEFVLPEWDASWLKAIWSLTPDNVESAIMAGIPGSPLFAVAFRRIAETSLLLSRSFTRTPMWQMRIRSEELLKEALPFAEHIPYLQEAIRECLYDYMDLSGLKAALTGLVNGQIEVVVQETMQPSPLAQQFMADYANMQLYEGDALDDAVQLQLMQVSKALAGELFGSESVARAVSSQVIDAEQERLSALPRPVAEPDDLFQLLKQRGDASAEELNRLCGADIVERLLPELERSGRIRLAPGITPPRWICADETEWYEQFPQTAASVAAVAGRFAEQVLSFTDDELVARYPQLLSAGGAEPVIRELLRQGKIEQAPFAAGPEERIWTSSNTAARIIRLSIQEARQEAEPIEPEQWLVHLAARQHLLHGTQLRGQEGLLAVIRKLQGYFLPLGLWESTVLPSRVQGYRKEDLDLLCASGEIIWIGKKDPGEKEGKIAFFLAESKALYEPYLDVAREAAASTSQPELAALLRDGGASFLTKLSRDSGKPPSELLSALMELVWEGLVSNDQFAPLRVFAATKGKQLARTGSGQGRWYWLADLADAAPLDDKQAAAEHVQRSAMEWARHMLDSHGLITKDLADAMSPYSWDQLLPMLKQLETWGVVTRGLFIRGVPSMQFVSRELIHALRQAGREIVPDDHVTLVPAVDPANPFGLAMSWPSMGSTSFARRQDSYFAIHRGELLLWVEGAGKRLILLSGNQLAQKPPLSVLKELLRNLLILSHKNKIKIDFWNDVPAAESNVNQALYTLGAERDRQSLVLWNSQLR